MTCSTLGDLEVYGVIASGGMATIEYAGQATAAGTLEVVIKRPHARFVSEPEFVAMFMDEARLSIRLRHANIVRTFGVLDRPDLALVLEYVPGESLFELLRLARGTRLAIPPSVAAALLSGVLHGLHAAHLTHGEDGQPLQIVHRDVTPENILVGADGIARVLDFGIAKAMGKIRSTPSGEFKGKPAYIAPEQVRGQLATHRTDVYSAGVVLWEALAGRSLFGRAHDVHTLNAVMRASVPALSAFRRDISEPLARIVQKALAREPEDRFDSAHAMACALETEVGAASQSVVMAWVEQLAGARMRQRRALLKSLRDAWQLTAAERTDQPQRVSTARGPGADLDACAGARTLPRHTVQLDRDSAGARTRPIETAALAVLSPHAPAADGCDRHSLAGAAVRVGALAMPPLRPWRSKAAWLKTAAAIGVAALGMSETASPSTAAKTASFAAMTAPAQAPADTRSTVVAQANAGDVQPQLTAAEDDALDSTANEALPDRRPIRTWAPKGLAAPSASTPRLRRADGPGLVPITDFGPRTPISNRPKLLLAERARMAHGASPSVLEMGWGRR